MRFSGSLLGIALTAMLLLLPFSHSELIPRQMFGITGFNPFNITILVVVAAMLLHSLRTDQKIIFPVFSPLLFAYILPILASATYGMLHIDDISPYFIASRFFLSEESPLELLSVGGYISSVLIKPMVLILVSYIVAVCVASFRIERQIRAIMFFAAVLVPISILIGLTVLGIGFSEISGAQDRGSLSWFGMHANELGLMLNISFALVVFGLFHDRSSIKEKKLGFVILTFISIGVVLTFSRGAFLGYFIIAMLYIARKGIKPIQLLIVPLFLIGMSLLPTEVFERMMTGVGNLDSDAISAGRIDMIWQPLLPVVFENILLGNGLGSIMWSTPMQTGAILPVGHAHNAYLGLLLDFGSIGAGLILFFWWRIWKLLSCLAADAAEWRGFFTGSKVAIIVLFIQGITDDRFTPTATQAFLWVAIGIAMGMAPSRKKIVLN